MRHAGLALLTVFVSVGLSGCTVGPNYKRPTVPLPPSYAAIAPPESTMAGASMATQSFGDVFRDPVLSTLITKALSSNHEVKIAAQRVLEARAYLGEVRADEYPYVSGGGSYLALHLPGSLASALNNNQFLRGGGPSASASWTIDFWGLYRRQTEAARAEMLANVWAQRAVQITVVESVAEAYFNLRSLDEQLDITTKTIATREASTKLVSRLEGAGVTNAEDLRQAEESLHEAKANLPSIRQAIAIQEHLISLLLGEIPGTIPRGLCIASQPRPEAVPAGLPSDLLERRPDLQRAEQELTAANARIGVAKAKYFPNIALTSLGGAASNQLNQIFTASGGYFAATGALSEPIFDAGRIRSENRFARAQDAEMEENYRQTILNAFRETSDALVSYVETHSRRIELERQVSSASEALRLANMRYQGGDTSYLEVLTVQTDLYGAQLAMARSRESEAASLAHIYAALGGGWR